MKQYKLIVSFSSRDCKHTQTVMGIFQLRRIPVTEADEHELEFEAKWIYQYAFDNATLSEQVSFHPIPVIFSESWSILNK